MNIRVQTTQNVYIQYEPASVGERILATLIDFFVYAAWALLIFLLFQKILSTTIFYIVILLPLSVYHLCCEIFLNGQSIGKRAMNTKVLMTDGSQATWGAYLLRWLFRPVDVMMFSGAVGIITVILNGKGQRLGDLAAKSTVVKIKQPVSLSRILEQKQKSIENHVLSFERASELSDFDIQVLKDTLKKENPELWEMAAQKVKERLDIIDNGLDDYNFLKIIIKDHTYLSLSTEA